MFSSSQQCMNASDGDVLRAAKKTNAPEHLTLDVKRHKLTLCAHISSHQQQAFLKSGLNKTVKHVLEKQKEDCESLCK